jgi:hypothetical protein
MSVKAVNIYPKELEDGKWSDFYTLSDHGILEAIFDVNVLDEISSDEIVNPSPLALKKKSDPLK